MILWQCCIQYVRKFGNLRSGHRTGKGQFSFQSQKGNATECSYYHTIVLISHASKIVLKILQAGLQEYMEQELTDVQAGFRNGRGTRDQVANTCWIIEKKKPENSRKTSTFASLTMLKSLTMWITTNCGTFIKRWRYQTTLCASWESCMEVKRQQNWTWNNKLIPYWERSMSRLYIVTLLI